MGAPIRLGFDRQHQPQEQFSSYQCQGSNPELPNPSLFRNAPASANNPNRSSQGSDFHFNPQTGYGPPPRSTSYNQRNGYRGHDSSRGRGRGTPRGGREGTSNHRPTAPPAVPSFLSSTLPLPPKPPVPVIDRPKKKKKRKHNVLGLTPRTEEYEESEDDDVDEEAVLGAAALGNQAGLTFEYKGQTSTLQTSSDITAWIAERRKRFPTKRRIEEKQAEKERRWKEARERETQLQKDLKESEKQKTAKEALAASQAQSAATMNAEAVKKKRDRAMKKIRKHEKALAKLKAEVVERAKDIREVPADAGQKRKREDTESDNVGLKAEPSSDGVGEPKMGHEEIQMPPLKQEETIATVIITTPPTEQGPVDAPEATRPVLSKPISPIPLSIAGERLPLSVDHQKAPSSPVGSDDSMSSTSSSISSSSSSASEGDNPEETSSRRTGPVRVPPPRRQKPNETPLCRQFVRTGSCRRGGFNGGRCTYRHELPPSGAASLGGRDGKNNWNGRGGRGKGREENGRRRVGLYQRMVEAEKEKEDILVLKAIKHLAEKGMLKEPDAEAE
ncbi:MAG: hypothetical protein M1817_002424 [Caeruleum heppii]|nr:MAG: hypothetical protein M1817_002424 [Caeruleum heppii]